MTFEYQPVGEQRDHLGRPVTEGRYSSCPVCGALFRQPVATQLTQPDWLTGWRELERELAEHCQEHTPVEYLTLINRLTAENQKLTLARNRIYASLGLTPPPL